MRKRVIEILKTDTVKQSMLTTVSTFTTAGLGAVYYLLLARFLGSENYGIFSLAIQIMLALTPLADLGTGTAIVRFIGEQPDKTNIFTSVALRIKIISGLIFLVIITLGSNFIANNFFNKPQLSQYLPIVGLGIIVLLLFNFSTAILQGLQKFIGWGSVQIFANVMRLILLGLIYIFGIVDPYVSVIVFILSFVFGILLSVRWINIKSVFTKINRKSFIDFWSFSRWTALFTIAAAISSRMDAFFTARYLDLSQTGIYSLALTMSSFLPQLASAIGAVTAPKFSKFNSPSDTHEYLKKALPFTSAMSLVVAISMIPVGFFVVWFTGKDFSSALVPFIILLGSMVVFAASGPIRDSILYSYKKPQIFFFAALAQGLVIVICGRILIPQYGIIGTSITSLLSQIVIFIISTISYIKLRKK